MKKILTVLIIMSSQLLIAQSKHSFEVEKSGTINLLEASKKPDQWYTSIKKIKKHNAKPKLLLNQKSSSKRTSTTPTLTDKITIMSNFAVPITNNAFPLDDEIAVGNDGKVVTASNRGLIIHSETGTTLANVSWQTFAGSVTNNTLLYDPRLIYDPINDRYIVVILNGDSEAADGTPNFESRLIIGFSQTNDPTGNYSLYKIEVTDLPNETAGDYLDYESIGISSNKLYIATNTSYTESIWKLDLAEGYAGNASVNTSIVNFAFDNTNHERGELFFIHNHNMNQDNHVYALTKVIDNQAQIDIALIKFSDNSNQSEEVLLNQNAQFINNTELFPTQPDGLQMAMGEDYFSGFVHNNKLTFSYRFNNNGNGEIFLNDINLNTTNFSQSSLGNNMATLNFPNSGIGYIEMVPVDCDTNDCDIIISLHSVSSTEYLTSKVAFISRNNEFTTPKIVKAGDVNTTNERVGDYIDIQKRYNKTGEAWLIGQYIFNDNGEVTLSDWVAQISTQESLSVNEFPYLVTKVFPNPSSDIVSVKIKGMFGSISADLYDVNGKLVKHILDKSIGTEEYHLSFNISHLSKGIYYLNIKDQNNKTINTKIAKN